MDKQEKVIKALEFCLMPTTNEELMSDVCSHDDCPYFREYKGGTCIEAVCKEALALLKAQEPVEPKVDVDEWRCGNCGHKLEHQELLSENVLFHEQYSYCPQCGKAVKWE